MALELPQAISQLAQGDHVCPIYESDEERDSVAVQFLREGLLRGERCFYIADDPPADLLERAIAAAGGQISRADAERAFELLTKQDTYLRSGSFSAEAMIDFLRQTEENALAEGFTGFRFLAEMSWVLGTGIDSQTFIEYEALLNDFMAGSHSVILCQYDRRRFDPAIIHDVLRAHPLVILGTSVCSNPYYEPPELILLGNRAAEVEHKRQRVGWWISRLQEAREDEQLRQAAEAGVRLRDQAFGAITQGILITDPNLPDNPIVYASAGFEKLTGYFAQEVLGRNCRFLQGPDTDPIQVARVHQAIESGKPCTVELLNYRKDGTPFWNELAITPIRDDKGRLTYFVGEQTDVTVLRKLRERLQQSQKVEAVGQLAGGIAHDFNNELAVIVNYSDMLLEEKSLPGDSHQMLMEIRKAAERSSALTRQLLAYSRKQVLALKVLDLNEVIHHMENMLRRTVGDDIELAVKLEPKLVPVRADRNQVEQVVLNFVVNARDAMPSGGRLTVETRTVELDRGAGEAQGQRPGTYVMLAVTDTGRGMTEEAKPHIFEPFFTTKPPGVGTGLGLAVVHTIVSQSGGHLEVDSRPERGTTFKVYLPQVQDVAVTEDAASETDSTPGGTETILLVEDESHVRLLAQHILQAMGYTVEAAIDGLEALRILEENDLPVDLLIVDLILPGMGGRVLAEQVQAMRPETRVLYISGYTDEAVMRRGAGQKNIDFLQKPFTHHALARKVREILDR